MTLTHYDRSSPLDLQIQAGVDVTAPIPIPISSLLRCSRRVVKEGGEPDRYLRPFTFEFG